MNEQQTSMAAQIAALASLPMPELWGLWDRHFRIRPLNPNRAFIESRIAYKIQETISFIPPPSSNRRTGGRCSAGR